MPNSRYSSYGKALFELIGNDKNELISYQKALEGVKKDLEKNPDLFTFLSSYAIPKEKQYLVVDELYGNSLKHLSPFLKVLVNKRLFPKFDEIVLSFNEFANEALGKEEGIIYSASRLSHEELVSIEKTLSERIGKEVVLKERVEPSLLGGVKVFVNGKVFDGSLESKIEGLRKELLKVAKGSSENENRN